jgi:hypothetical protein
MLVGRFGPIVLALAIAGSLAGARVHARTRATLDTSGPTFVAFLLGVIVIVGGLIYFPMLILGPTGSASSDERSKRAHARKRPAARGQAPGDKARPAAYRHNVIVAVTLAVAVLLAAAVALAWTARLLHVGNLDALALADKVGVPHPASALDWPELHLRAIIPLPDEPPLVLLLVGWPAHPRSEATLLVALDSGDHQSVPLLSQWCATSASVSPTRQEGAALELRRRRSLERVRAVLVAEDGTPAWPG